MSRDQNVAKRYARALFELAKERGETDRIGEQLRAAAEALGGKEAASFFRHPSIKSEEKLAVLDKVLADRVSEPVLHTLQLMIKRGRANALQALVEQYGLLADEDAGRATAIVTTPLPLTEEQAEAIAAHYSNLTGKQIRVRNVINEQLLGGMQVTIGDRMYDASLSAKLERMKKQFA
jgi:F-type H+-transporting ATPase subunit delta